MWRITRLIPESIGPTLLRVLVAAWVIVLIGSLIPARSPNTDFGGPWCAIFLTGDWSGPVDFCSEDLDARGAWWERDRVGVRIKFPARDPVGISYLLLGDSCPDFPYSACGVVRFKR